MSKFGDACRALWENAPEALLGAIDADGDQILEKYGINTRLRVLHFGAQISHESGGAKFLQENLNYSATRLMQVWPSRFPSAAVANAYAHNPEKIANYVYGGRLGNNQPGDGWKYRGHGMLQETGRYNYTDMEKHTGLPVLDNPDLVSSPEHALECAAYRFVALGCLPYADRNDIKGVTRHVNGGYNGLSDRMEWYKDWNETYDVESADASEDLVADASDAEDETPPSTA